MKKRIILAITFVSLASLFLLVTPSKSRLKSYYSGDAISYRGQIYVASTNTGSLELFRLENDRLELLTKIKPYNFRFHSYGEFFDVKLMEENNHLYAYAVSNFTLYKYEVVNRELILVTESKNTYWEWYNRVDKFGNDIVTISAKGVKVFDRNLNAIVAYDFTNIDAPYNVSGPNARYFLSMNEAKSAVEIYDKDSRSLLKTIPLNFNHSKGNRRAYQDSTGYIYAVDDFYAKKFDLNGKLIASFRHLDYQGFDVAASGHNDYIYFSNGVGIVKLDKDMKLIDYAWTGNLGGQAGWAMGLKVVYNGGDKIVIFNNSNILILDDKLDKVASVASTETADDYPLENLYLRLDKSQATVNSDILLTGGGFLPQESLSISFAGKYVKTINADSNGRLSTVLKVPSLSLGRYDIKVEGLKSGLHYSISFQVN